jgi:hypothetical protein
VKLVGRRYHLPRLLQVGRCPHSVTPSKVNISPATPAQANVNLRFRLRLVILKEALEMNGTVQALVRLRIRLRSKWTNAGSGMQTAGDGLGEEIVLARAKAFKLIGTRLLEHIVFIELAPVPTLMHWVKGALTVTYGFRSVFESRVWMVLGSGVDRIVVDDLHIGNVLENVEGELDFSPLSNVRRQLTDEAIGRKVDIMIPRVVSKEICILNGISSWLTDAHVHHQALVLLCRSINVYCCGECSEANIM